MNDLTYSQPPRRVRKKPGPTARRIAKRRRAAMKDHASIRDYVFQREQDICRCCRLRRAESMHELVFRSLGGKVSKRNSIAVCGQLVGTEVCCHTFLQHCQIDWRCQTEGAEDLLEFKPTTQAAADWMRVKIGLWVASMPGGRNEEMPA